MVKRKDELEVQLKDEHQLIKEGLLRDESPLDTSPEFQELCVACRIGDVKRVQQAITTPGININARDPFDYTPLILVSLVLFPIPIDPTDRSSRQVFVDITMLLNYFSKLELSANAIHFKARDVYTMH